MKWPNHSVSIEPRVVYQYLCTFSFISSNRYIPMFLHKRQIVDHLWLQTSAFLSTGVFVLIYNMWVKCNVLIIIFECLLLLFGILFVKIFHFISNQNPKQLSCILFHMFLSKPEIVYFLRFSFTIMLNRFGSLWIKQYPSKMTILAFWTKDYAQKQTDHKKISACGLF